MGELAVFAARASVDGDCRLKIKNAERNLERVGRLFFAHAMNR
jgi:hypothetical protein